MGHEGWGGCRRHPYLRGASGREALIGDWRGGGLVGGRTGAAAVLLQGGRLWGHTLRTGCVKPAPEMSLGYLGQGRGEPRAQLGPGDLRAPAEWRHPRQGQATKHQRSQTGAHRRTDRQQHR